jgi:hypothetical protein
LPPPLTQLAASSAADAVGACAGAAAADAPLARRLLLPPLARSGALEPRAAAPPLVRSTEDGAG